MQFEMGVAYRGSSAPEVKQVVEANTMREAMEQVTRRFGDRHSVLVTYAQYLEARDPVATV
jgi:ribosomal protein L20A (L18A)